MNIPSAVVRSVPAVPDAEAIDLREIVDGPLRPRRSGSAECVQPFLRAVRPDRLVLIGLALFVLTVYVGQSVRSNTPDHGDWWSDMELVESAERLDQFGLWTSRLALPLDDGYELGTQPYLYANWPTMTFQAQALAYRAGLEPRQVRVLPLLQTAAAAYVFFCFARLVAGRRTARFATAFLLTAAPVRLLADSFGYVPVDLLGRAGTFLIVAVTAGLDKRSQGRARVVGIVLGVLAVASQAAVLGLESFPAAALFAFAYPLVRTVGRRGTVREALVPSLVVSGLGVLLGVLGRLFFVVILPGPLGGDLSAMRNAARVRLNGDPTSFSNTFAEEWAHRIWVYVPVLAALALGAVAVAAVRAGLRRKGRMLALGAVVLVAELAWVLVAREHTHRHVHTIALLLFSMTLPAGWLAAEVTGALHRWAPSRLTGLGVAVASVCGFGFILSDPGVQPYGNVTGAIDWSAAEAEVGQLRSALAEGTVVGVSDSVLRNGPVLTFLIDRPVMRLPNPAFVQQAQQRPAVFVFRKDFPDDTTAAALAAGTLVGETPTYAIVAFADPRSIPPSLDPNG